MNGGGEGVERGERPALEANAKQGRETAQACEILETDPHCGGIGLGGEGPDAAASAAAPAPAALPCQKSNNSTETGISGSIHRREALLR
jgi:hypothetical protein